MLLCGKKRNFGSVNGLRWHPEGHISCQQVLVGAHIENGFASALTLGCWCCRPFCLICSLLFALQQCMSGEGMNRQAR